MHMLEIEDTKVFTVVELKPKSIFRERGKHVKYLFFVCLFQEKEGEEKAYLDNSDLGFLPSLLKTKSFRVCVSKYLW